MTQKNGVMDFCVTDWQLSWIFEKINPTEQIHDSKKLVAVMDDFSDHKLVSVMNFKRNVFKMCSMTVDNL